MAAVILAAGTSARLGQPKQLLTLRGRPLLQHVIDAAADSGVSEIVLVLGHAADEVAAALTLPRGARVVMNPDFAAGQSTSLHAAVAALDSGVEAAVLLLGDQPGMSSRTIRAVVDAFDPEGLPIVRATYRGRPGHPVLIGRDLWPTLFEARGDKGARDLIAARPDLVAHLDVDDDPPPDVDTWEDYTRLLG